MMEYSWTAVVTIVALLVYIGLGLQVAGARGKSGIEAPAMTGHPTLERAVRVHINTLEWLPVFLAALWLFALYWNEKVAAGLGVVWIIGRLLYSRGYMADPAKRSTGFLVQALTTLALLLGALGRIVYTMATGGA
jgi:glutathione S-transferase